MKHPLIYEVYLVKFPFVEFSNTKIRPVIVISSTISKHNVLSIIPVSSKPDKEEVDMVIEGWKESGLVKKSVARVHRISTITQTSIDAYLGKLDRKDIKNLKIALKNHLCL